MTQTLFDTEEAEMAQAVDIYTRSNGSRMPVREMVTNHLKSAFAKLAREFPGHPELRGMSAEIERRDAEFADAQRSFETTGAVADHQAEDPFS